MRMDLQQVIHTNHKILSWVGAQVLDILARLAIAERASIDECYLDITQEASKRLSACSGHPPLPSHAEQVHVCGEARMS